MHNHFFVIMLHITFDHVSVILGSDGGLTYQWKGLDPPNLIYEDEWDAWMHLRIIPVFIDFNVNNKNHHIHWTVIINAAYQRQTQIFSGHCASQPGKWADKGRWNFIVSYMNSEQSIIIGLLINHILLWISSLFVNLCVTENILK